MTSKLGWDYSAAHHCLIVHHSNGGLAIDLTTGDRFATNLGGQKNRAQDAWAAWERGQIPARRTTAGSTCRIGSENTVWSGDTLTLYLNANIPPTSEPEKKIAKREIRPLADGRSMLRDRHVVSAQFGGDILAAQTLAKGVGQELKLHLIDIRKGTAISECQVGTRKNGFRLSVDGHFLARQLGDAKIEISQVAGNIASMCRTHAGGYINELPFILGGDEVALLMGRHAVVVGWTSGMLRFRYYDGATPEVKRGIRSTAAGVPNPCRYDTRRWLQGASGVLLAASDRYGQIVLFDQDQNLVCMFFAFRGRLAGWMPDGTHFGPTNIDGDIPTEVAREFARALRRVTRRRYP